MHEKEDSHKKISFIKVFAFGLKVNMETFPLFFIVASAAMLVHGLLYGFTTLNTWIFFDSVSSMLASKDSLDHVYLTIIVLGLTLIMREIMNGISNFMYTIMFNRTNGEMAKRIHKKMARIDPICFDDIKLYNDLEKATSGASAVMGIVNIGLLIFTYYLPYLIFMSFYLHYLKPQFILAMLFVFVPVFFTQLIRTGIITKFEDKAAPIRREYDFYIKAITDKEYFKETRKLGAYPFFLERLIDQLKNLSKAEWERSKSVCFLEFGLAVISALGYAGILYILVTTLLSGDITVGAFAAVLGSIESLFRFMQGMINATIGGMASVMGQAHNFIRFMELPERSGADGVQKPDEGIVAHNISFTYPNAMNKSVDGVSIAIKPRETIAIVGENGAGKTTLVRLLIGLYTPAEGSVAINGMDTSKTNTQSLFRNVSGVFQRFQRYQMTLKENVQISDIDNTNTIENAIRQAGIEMSKTTFPKGEETMLSRQFNGIELSGGEWQKVAIARGLYRFHNIIILDEPTAAIDPIEESRIYHKFIEISKDKIAIIVTHRLGSTKIADRVILMNEGRIIDCGSHYELIERCELYANMYNSQAEWY